MAKSLNKAQVNHLRRLLGWMRCEVGQSPEEMVTMMKGLLPRLGPVSEDGKQRLVEAHQAAARVPKYIRAAIKALEPVVAESRGEIVDAEVTAGLPQKRRSRPKVQVSQQAVPYGGAPYGGVVRQRLLPEPCMHGLWLCDLCQRPM